MRVRPHFVLTVVSWAFVPLSMFCLLGSCFGAVFQGRVVVANETGERIVVTPLGRSWDGRRLRSLPLSYARVLFIPRWHRGGFEMDPGERLTLIFDRDDIVLSEIAVGEAGAAASAWQWTAPRRPDGTPLPRGAVIEIRPRAEMDPVDPAVREMALVAGTFELRWLLFDAFLLNLVLALSLGLRLARQEARASGTSVWKLLFVPTTQAWKV